MENEKKTTEQHAQDRDANNLLNFIIAKTFSRHSKMDEKEFLKDIGYENSGKTEDEAIRLSIFNLLIETTNQFIKARESVGMSKELLKTFLEEKGE